MNGYARLTNLKADLNITGATNDAALVRLTEDVSRAIDNLTGRTFYSQIATYYFDGEGYSELDLERDLISLTSLDVDPYGALTYPTNLTAAMYQLGPVNLSPKHKVSINLRATGLPVSAFPGFAAGTRITGLWGYSNDTELTGATTAGITNAATTLAVSDGTLVSVGETLVLDSEQVYVSAIVANNLTVVRGVNGTSAVSHGAISVYRRRYEPPIERATVLEVSRLWRDAQTGYSGTGYSGQAASAEFGGFAFNALYPAIRDMLAPYISTWRNWVFV